MKNGSDSDLSDDVKQHRLLNVSKKRMQFRVFNSFKEQEDEMVAYWASITPLQRLVHLY